LSADRRTFLGGMALLAGTGAAAQTPFLANDARAPFFPPKERFPLWPGKPPGAPKKPIAPDWTMNNPPPNSELWLRGINMPEVHVYRPARSDSSSLLVLPGGGYGFLSVQNEGLDPAERFNAERTTVFMLTYRLPGEGWDNRSVVALQDAQRAMRLIRSRAADYKVDPARLGVLGFSAGGHLAADLAVSHASPVYKQVDAADQLSARPAFAGLVYPVITMDTHFSEGSSQPNWFGDHPDPALIAARPLGVDEPLTLVEAQRGGGYAAPGRELANGDQLGKCTHA